MNQDTHRSTTSYYRTLYSKYRVDDAYLQTRGQRRATGAFLEQLETKDLLPGDSVPKRQLKRLNRAFLGSAMFRHIAAALTVAAMLTLLQTPPVSADVTADQRVGALSEVGKSAYRQLLTDDEESEAVSLDQTDDTHKTSLHFISHKAPYSPVSFGEENALSIDGDSDMPWRIDQGRSLTVIDTSIDDWQILKEAVVEGDVLLLKGEDPVDAIIEKLRSLGGVDALSIISHGDSGALYFDGIKLSADELEQQAGKWRELGAYLSDEGDIHLFGCNVADGEAGKAFIAKLAEVTGADVAASINPTGNPEQSGDWVLEAVQGDAEDLRAMNYQQLSAFNGVLAWSGTIDFSQVRDAGAYNGAPSINASFYNDASNTYTLVGDALVSSSYSGAGYLAAPNVAETQLTLSFLNSEVFNTSGIFIYNCSGGALTFKVTSNLGDSATIPLADASGGNIDLSGFSASLTSLDITNNVGGVLGCFYVDNFVITNLQSANTPPALGGTFTTAGAVNDNATTSPFSSVSVSDADADNVSVAITYTAANGTLSGTGLTGSAGSYTVTSATPATATTNLQGIVFTPTANQVAAGSTVVSTFTLTPNDGTANGTSDGTTQITATSINDNPTITSNGGGATGPASVNENTTSVTTVTATDVDPSTTITYSISGGADAAAFSINPGSGALTFSSAPNFETPTDSGANNVYDVQVTATDNGPGSLTDVQDLAVTVNNVNENPLITSDGGGASAALNAAENQTTVTTVSAFDSDTGDTLTYSISGGADAALFGIIGASGVLTFNAAPDFEVPTDSGANGVYDVQVTVTDDGAGNLTDVQDIAVTVTSVNENPTITSNGGGASGTAAVNENTTAVTTVTSTDPDSGDTPTYSISGGADAAAFSINPGSGALTFSSAPDFETPTDSGTNNVYDVQVTVTDDGAGNLTDVQDLAVTVNNANDNPTITSDGGGASAALNAAENQTAVTTVAATDQDTGDTLTYSISGGADAALFGIIGASGVLTFNAAPDFEVPTDSGANNVYDVQVTATDDGTGNLTDVQDIAVTVTSINENPVITSNGGGASGATNINENTTAVTTVTATDPDSGDTLTYSISGGADAGLFGIIGASGVLTFNAAPDFETPTDNGANNVYDVQVTVTDDGTGNLTDVQDLAVTVNDVNDNPVITSDGGGTTASLNAAENQTAVTTVTATDPDTGDTLTYSISGGADAALFNINGASGVLNFLAAPVFNSPTDNGGNGVYDVQVTVTDDGAGNLTDVQDIAVTVVDVNVSPGGNVTISGSAAEDQVLTAGNTLTDIDGLGAISYQWNRDGSAVSGATNTTYTLGDDDVGHTISVTASYTDGGGTLESVTSSATAAVANINDSPTGSVTISGETTQGQTLTADASGLADSDGLGVFSYRWQSGTAEVTENSGTYTLTASDVGNTITVSVSYTDGQGTQESVTSNATATVAAAASDVPVVVAPADITVDATGLFTEIDIGTATATDTEDGDLTPAVTQIVSNDSAPAALSGTPVFFSPGIHLLSWTATDTDDNTGLDTQTVHVVPMVSFSKDQVSAEGETASFKAILNGPAVNYPVTVPYTVSGTMLNDGSDHNLSDGSVTIDHPALEASVSVSFIDDGANEGTETLVIAMGTPGNAIIGPVSSHHIEVREGNVAPTVELIADQGGTITRIIGQTDGTVAVTAIVTDPNRGDVHSYDWSGSDNSLIDTDADPATFTFDPANLDPGAYTLKQTVSDGVASGVAELLLKVVSALPSLTETDSDDDGLSDTSEGSGDNDGDGIPNYLDHAGTALNVIQEQQATASEYLMETEPGLVFMLGDVAFRAHGHSTHVTGADIENHGNEGTGAEADAELYVYNGGLFDFRIEGLPITGQSVAVVLPQLAPIPVDAVYRKLMPSGWQDFVVDDYNHVASVAGSAGYCPPPGDASYIAGLTEGDWCVQLTIQDGGPNDADEAADTNIDDPGGVAQRLPQSTGETKSGGGGGGVSLFSLILLGLAFLRRQKKLFCRYPVR
ncbi:MAG: cadherin domain-containing protein [Candidatus Thiodiazotropha sp. (ex Dulcina madagascariensis)]|nr:cadherin domain-containing protein [Candidatus Thiodiazotropha sp. (ex Dulcina madagascariensis)]